MDSNIKTALRKQTNVRMGGRIEWLDTMRGIAILLVVLGHSIGSINDPVNRFILSFHMPLFFFISGILAKTTDKQGNNIPFAVYFLSKTRAILLPQMVLLVEKIGIDYFKHEPITINLILKETFNWFLIVLWYTVLLYFFIVKTKIIDKKVLLYTAISILIIVFQVINLKTIVKIEIAPMALLFYVLGNDFAPFLKSRTVHLSDYSYKNLIKNVWVVFFPLIVLLSYWNSPVTMYDNSYGLIPVFLVTSTLGIWFVYELSMRIYDNSILNFLGQNSIIVYVIHYGLLNVLHILGSKIFPVLSEKNYKYPANWHYFMITVITLVPIIIICNKYFYFMFGKKKRSKRS